MLAVNIAVLVNERSIQFNDLLKIAMIACDSTLQGDSEHFFIHYYHHPPSYASEDALFLSAFGWIRTELNN